MPQKQNQHEPNIPEVLIIGSEGAGKTLLVNRIKQIVNKADKTNFDPRRTTGVELDMISYGSTTFLLREVGFSMSATWPSYFQSCDILMFVVDKSDRSRIAIACAELMMALNAMPNTPLILVVNKRDMPDCLSKWELNELLRLDDLQGAGRELIYIETSAMQNTGIQSLVNTLSYGSESLSKHRQPVLILQD